MLPFKLVYTDGYDLNLGNHVFPSVKFKRIREQCLADGMAAAEDFLQPQPAPDEDILRVHTQEWVRKLKTGRLSPYEIMRLEVPYSPQLVRAFWLSAGGSTLAARRALADRCAFNLGGGFHHAFPDHGEGFCVLNDVAVALRRLQAEGLIQTALVVDLDVHHGNGTAAIFAADPSVFTLSMHQENNYPYPKPPSNLDVGLDDFTRDDTYLRLLTQALDRAFNKFAEDALKRVPPAPSPPRRSGAKTLNLSKGAHSKAATEDTQATDSSSPSLSPVAPLSRAQSRDATGSERSEETRPAGLSERPDLLFYLAGADPYKEDQLGGLALTLDGLRERDRLVIEAARSRSIPIAITFAGGYARRVQDTVQIHINTIRAARQIFQDVKPQMHTDEHG